MYCFSSTRWALRSKSKYLLAQNQDNVFQWSHMSTRGLLFQWTSTINTLYPTKRVFLVQNEHNHHLDRLYLVLRMVIIAHLALNNNHSLTLYFMTITFHNICPWYFCFYMVSLIYIKNENKKYVTCITYMI